MESKNQGPRKQYVVGFLFDEDHEHVLLILKQRPEWQKNHFNGIGGHVEPGETHLDAMKREMQEEAGIKIDSWDRFSAIQGRDYDCSFFRASSDLIFKAQSKTDEQVVHVPVSNLDRLNCLSNVPWLVKMALCERQLYTLIPH